MTDSFHNGHSDNKNRDKENYGIRSDVKKCENSACFYFADLPVMNKKCYLLSAKC